MLTHKGTKTIETDRLILRQFTMDDAAPKFRNWAIVLKENGPEPIGNISVVHVKDSTLCATMGYCMSRAHWRKGIMAEALTALIAFLFDEVGFNRIEADHDIENPASGRVMQKSGMTFEGTSRQGGHNNRGIVDLCHWAILRSDR